jgi:hypothetical protein
MSNPFYYGGRVEPDQFVGRQSELRRIFTALEVAQPGKCRVCRSLGRDASANPRCCGT